jgi:hypothetical protein
VATAPADREVEGGARRGAEPATGAELRVRSGPTSRKPGARGEGRGSPRHCAAGGPRAAGPWTSAAPGHGEQGSAAPRVCSQPQEDEAAAGHRPARLRRL